jgi:hypothetical protein
MDQRFKEFSFGFAEFQECDKFVDLFCGDMKMALEDFNYIA